MGEAYRASGGPDKLTEPQEAQRGGYAQCHAFFPNNKRCDGIFKLNNKRINQLNNKRVSPLSTLAPCNDQLMPHRAPACTLSHSLLPTSQTSQVPPLQLRASTVPLPSDTRVAAKAFTFSLSYLLMMTHRSRSALACSLSRS